MAKDYYPSDYSNSPSTSGGGSAYKGYDWSKELEKYNKEEEDSYYQKPYTSSYGSSSYSYGGGHSSYYGGGYSSSYGGSYTPYYSNYSKPTKDYYSSSNKSFSGFGYVDTSKYTDYFETIKERKAYKEKIKKYTEDKYGVSRLDVKVQDKPFFSKRNGVVKFSIPPNKDLEKYVKEALSILPFAEMTSDWVDDKIFADLIYGNNQSYITRFQLSKSASAYATLREHYLKDKEAEAKADSFKEKANSIMGGGIDIYQHGSTVCPERRKSLTKKLNSKFSFTKSSYFTPSTNRGKRVNRAFAVGQNFNQPLLNREVEKKSKKKIMFIIDSSGSMGSESSVDCDIATSHAASVFASAVYGVDAFEVTHVVHHGSYGWKDAIHEYRKGNFLYTSSGGGEGFENIDLTIPKEWARDADYVVCLTDLDIGTSSQEGIREYLLEAKRYQLLSFSCGDAVKGLRCKVVKSFDDMVSSLIKLAQ